MTSLRARVTVGVVVYNGEATLRRAVESVLNQTYKCVDVHISDDGSSDRSAEIGKLLSAEYTNVMFTRQNHNLQPANNFRFFLRERVRNISCGWLRTDCLEPTYLTRMLQLLDGDTGWLPVSPGCTSFSPDGSKRLSWSPIGPLTNDPATNLAIYLFQPYENGLYALYRTGPLQKAFPKSHFHAFDWAAVAGTLLYGTHAEISDVLMARDDTPKEHYTKSVRADNTRTITRIFPASILTYDLVIRQRIPLTLRILKALAFQNLEHHLRYMRMFHPVYVKLTGLFWKIWETRLRAHLLRDA